MPLKIALIGAGSVVWGSTVIRDLLNTPELKAATVALMDINKERLNVVYQFATRYAGEIKSDMKFSKTTDRREAIRDADFVVNSAMAGGHQYYEKMRAVSEKHGYFRGINSVEWNMVSDYHTIWGYYQFKLAKEIAEDVEKYSPNAWFLDVANPVLELTTLLGRLFKIKLIGLCDGYFHIYDIIETLDYKSEEIEAEAIGVNHLIWLTKFKRKSGEDLYPALREWIETKYPSYHKKWLAEARSRLFSEQLSPAMVDMYKTYGLVPIGDTIRNGTWKYHRNLRTKKKWYGPLGGVDSPIGWKLYLENQEKKTNMIREALAKPEPLSKLFPPSPHKDPVVSIINAIANDVPGKFEVNVLNEGTIDGVPNNIAVETPAVVDGRGVHREKGLRLPTKIMNFALQPRIQRVEWALEAFLEGGREILFEWLVDDPRTRTNKQAERVIDDLLAMPENEEMAKHFR